MAEPLLYDLFRAYYDARRNKRNTLNAVNFEINYEENLMALYAELSLGAYTPRPGICFISFKPVQREIFAADFRDRVVHHLIYNYISPVFEKTFIHDSYSCRKGKGTHFGINRINHFIRSCSENYTLDCYILKLDIEGYFMSIDKVILFEMIRSQLERTTITNSFDTNQLVQLIRTVIFHDPTKSYSLKGSRSDWNGLPASKSLFHSSENKGLPIGNLTSQLFSNIYLNQQDHFVKGELGFRYYGRYVDDFIIIERDIHRLKRAIGYIDLFLRNTLNLNLHPNKRYLQHYSKGVQFLGVIIKPHRNCITARLKGNLYSRLKQWNDKTKENATVPSDLLIKVRAILNSYLGLMHHSSTYKLRKKILLEDFKPVWGKYFLIPDGFRKIILRRHFRIHLP